MKNKGLIAIILAAVIVICAGAAFALTRNNGKDKTQTQTASGQAVSETAESVPQTPAQQSESQTESAQASTAAQAADEYSFLKSGVWYYFDETKREAYAFEFDGKDDVDITYYNSDNINGEDTKTASGDADYKIENGKIIIDDVPGNLEADGFTFKIGKDTVTDENGAALEKTDKASLEYAFDHFNS